ncbi:hypothetical protein [Brachybacterium saurashtrense]|nr:hypothetical protein [Brachybacterium saurashtrense]
MHIRALGTALELLCDGSVPAETVREVLESWSDARIPGVPGAERISLSVGPGRAGRALVTVDRADQLGQVLSTVVTQRALTRRRGTHVLLHACGLALEDGRVIAFVGPSGMGKTTLARTLGRRWGYVTDETVAIATSPERYGQVLPFPKPLSIVQEGAPKRQVSPSALGLAPLPDVPLRIAAIVLIERSESPVDESGRFRPGPAEIESERLPLAESVGLLAPHLSYLSSLEQPLSELARLIEGVGGVVRLRYREAAQVATVVDELVSADPHDRSGTGRWNAGDVPGIAAGAAHPETAATRTWSPAPATDWLDTGGAVVVLRGTQVHVLSGIAPPLWRRALASPRPGLPELTSAVVDAVGRPPGGGAEDRVLAALGQLVDEGVLVTG